MTHTKSFREPYGIQNCKSAKFIQKAQNTLEYYENYGIPEIATMKCISCEKYKHYTCLQQYGQLES